ncbi:MAG: hypothetical protein UV82_C0006G0050 [Candidatus Magasanikbacteria bacterium GW2011_GWD2_43_18]|uniref:Uncharacterized protein n=1 Tax=Candidatus Magasanikbacteria bacterium GW2011_GWE2_42_7 TaxID=1619052 RepID=A0A0G1EA55_9BACT|nr:MAG: hypothetical protein UV18_C0005G0037 [Candidatus Magasanikbacteria bacterium GW2011_GWC2_42_27]KKS71473.1 MAG: hypothetical protein UV42_C0027G0009 [Candidatus Magasanikbacteria bacterium GW2011_GWE2_42_7]KKT04694.1 MAG: hypothetical protein UV82_C0006G0050 [Candidatus Magasanikbacteria bacterium GW2011_GWD2_43_18]KKT25000.1 MAG: hypothetical protein UW10_C0016G0033 [Candidatus Magasanikbacteria bacterium GW2011_GWA2_43_9]
MTMTRFLPSSAILESVSMSRRTRPRVVSSCPCTTTITQPMPFFRERITALTESGLLLYVRMMHAMFLKNLTIFSPVSRSVEWNPWKEPQSLRPLCDAKTDLHEYASQLPYFVFYLLSRCLLRHCFIFYPRQQQFLPLLCPLTLPQLLHLENIICKQILLFFF